MIAEVFGIDGAVALMVSAVILFGSSQLPKVVKNLGEAGREIRNIRKGTHGEVMPIGEESTVERSAALKVSGPHSDLDVDRTTTFRNL